MKLTSNLSLKKPEGTDNVRIDDLNDNMDILDTEVVKKASDLVDGRMSKEDKAKLDAATSAATASTVMVRDASGRAKVAAPSATDDVARLGDITKTQVGLGSVENYSIASKSEAEAGTASNRYMTPERTAQAITELAAGGDGKRTARFVIGASTAGWTASDVDYLCDGTDDQVEINAAITALPVGGGEIVILDGTYNITAKINVNKSNVKLRGNGNATILKRMWDSESAEGVITLNNASDCIIASLQIDGNRNMYDSVNYHGIYLIGTSLYNLIKDNMCRNCRYAIYVAGSSSSQIITNNDCSISCLYGIYVQTNGNLISDNICNNITLSNSCAMYITGSNNMISGNVCCGNKAIGLAMSGVGSNNTITGNTFNGNGTQGIATLGSNKRNTITGNTCNDNISTGISLTSYTGNNIVVGNNTSGSGTGINDQGSGNVVANNI